MKGYVFNVKTKELKLVEDDTPIPQELQEAGQKIEQERIKKEQAKQSAIGKLKQLGLTDEEIEALKW